MHEGGVKSSLPNEKYGEKATWGFKIKNRGKINIWKPCYVDKPIGFGVYYETIIFQESCVRSPSENKLWSS